MDERVVCKLISLSLKCIDTFVERVLISDDELLSGCLLLLDRLLKLTHIDHKLVDLC